MSFYRYFQDILTCGNNDEEASKKRKQSTLVACYERGSSFEGKCLFLFKETVYDFYQ